MKGLRFLLLGLAICLAGGVKAQFYDSADDIYYYVEAYEEIEEIAQVLGPGGIPTLKWEKTGKISKNMPKEGAEKVYIYNFDGLKAAELAGGWNGEDIYIVKKRLQESPSYYEDKVETTEYRWKYVSSTSGVVYQNGSYSRIFSRDRNTLIQDNGPDCRFKKYYKRVDKSFFKVGRSRTPSGTMHE